MAFQINKESKYKESCILTLHGEGILCHTTIRSIEEQRLFAENYGMAVELVVILDRADSLTRKQLLNHSALRDTDQILEVNNGDLGLSRNVGIENSLGDIIAIYDGDDYYSKNWLYEGTSLALKYNYSLCYPEYVFSFDKYYSKFKLPDIDKGDYSIYSLLFIHPLVSSVIFHKKIFESIQYASIQPGFGYEDWNFCNEALSYGYKPKITKNTALFYRRKKEGSLLSAQLSNDALPLPSRLFKELAFDYLYTTLPKDNINKFNTTYFCKKNIKYFLNCFPYSIQKPLSIALKKSYLALCKFKKLVNKTPSFTHLFYTPYDNKKIRSFFLEISSIDPILHPSNIPNIQQYKPDFNKADKQGRIFIDIYSKIVENHYDIIYVVPWIIVGGADKVIINLANTAAQLNKKVLVFSTLNEISIWSQKLDKSVDFINIASYIKDYDKDFQRIFLAKLLLQLAPKNIHFINSQLGYEVLSHHGKAFLTQNIRLISTFFCDEKFSDGIDRGYAVQYLRKTSPLVSFITTDNNSLPKYWSGIYGVNISKFKTIYNSCNIKNFSTYNSKKLSPKSILWASRLSLQKRPDILLKIAQNMLCYQFHIWGTKSSEPEISLYLSHLTKLPNVTFHGSYDEITSLPIPQYGVFLYTSCFDGLPNVLLEVTGVGLPIVAPNIGGISDLINQKTGWLIEEPNILDKYVSALKEAIDYPELAAQKVSEAQKLVAARHTMENFKHNVKEIYL